MKPKQNTIAIVYDFDGTLSPGNMQEPTIFAKYKIDSEEFWKKSERLVVKEGYERTLAYMKLLMHDPIFEASPLSHQSLTELGSRIKYFKGVESYF
ncbi:MAG: haloacid dehalogenase-like hydrolase, partial [Candidatus Omnitrophica bacterium]|nr:haloacid dehalogenase-like hydrolase [Candidatus Omnitrophota bacterium]